MLRVYLFKDDESEVPKDNFEDVDDGIDIDEGLCKQIKLKLEGSLEMLPHWSIYVIPTPNYQQLGGWSRDN